jgi:hypothetical protein
MKDVGHTILGQGREGQTVEVVHRAGGPLPGGGFARHVFTARIGNLDMGNYDTLEEAAASLRPMVDHE